MRINRSNPRRRAGASRKNEERRGEQTSGRSNYADGLKAGAARRAEDNEKAKVGDDVDDNAMVEATGTILLNESDLKYDEVVGNFINQLSEETFGELYGTISGKVRSGQRVDQEGERGRDGDVQEVRGVREGPAGGVLEDR